MTCEERDRRGDAGHPDVREHVQNCQRCRELDELLSTGPATGGPSAAILKDIESEIKADLKPVRPLAPAGVFAAALALIFLLLVAYGTHRLGAFAMSVMSAVQMWSVFLSLAASAALLAFSLVRQMAPGSKLGAPPSLLPMGIVVLLLLVMAAVFQMRAEPNFLQAGLICLSAGIPFALVGAVAFFFVLRKGAILSPRVTGALTGLLAGLIGTTVLEIHCPNLDLLHIVMWHLGVAVLGALVGLVLGLFGERIGRNFLHRRGEVSH